MSVETELTNIELRYQRSLADPYDPITCENSLNDVPALVKALRRAMNGIEATLRDNRHLADGEICTLIVLKRTLPAVAQLLREPEKKQDLD